MTKQTPNRTRPRTRAKKKGASTSTRKTDSTMRPGGKLGLILDRLEDKTGATLGELIETIG